jgi:hypothetical protein
MDGIREFLEAIRQHHLVEGRLRGILHVAIGRRITRTDGHVLSAGVTWRQLASVLKAMRFDKAFAAEVGADPETLSPRDRERFWYAVIAMSKVDSPEAKAQGDRLAAQVKPLGYLVGAAPTGGGPPPPPPADERKKKKKK